MELFNTTELHDDLTVYVLPPSYLTEVGKLIPRFKPR